MTNLEFKGVNKILIVKLRYIGDVLLTVPTIRAVRENFPSAQIFVLVNKGTESVLEDNPMIDELIVFERKIKKMHFFKKIFKEIDFIKKIRSCKFDMVIDLISGDRGAVLSFLSGAKYRLANSPCGQGFWGKERLYTHVAQRDFNKHAVLQDLNVVKQFGITTENLDVEFIVNENELNFARKKFKEAGITEGDFVIAIQPTSRVDYKCWSDEAFAELIDILCEKGAKVVFTASADKTESSIIDKILCKCSHTPINIGPTTLKQLAAILKMSNLFIGLDSAPMHIAAAVGTPVIAIFGPLPAYMWGPWYGAPPYGYTKKSGVQFYGHHSVFQKEWECVPCNNEGCNSSRRSRCLESTTAEEVMKLIKFPGEVNGR